MIFETELIKKLREESENVTIIVSNNEIIEEAMKITPAKKVKGITILVRCAQEHKAAHSAAFKVYNSDGRELEVYVSTGKKDNKEYGFYPVGNPENKLSSKQVTYVKKFAVTNGKIVEKLWDCKKGSKNYNKYINEIKNNCPNCTFIGDPKDLEEYEDE